MQLLFCGNTLGAITDVGADQPWWIGQFEPNEAATPFEQFFAWIVDEERNTLPGEPPFEKALWTDENWAVKSTDGVVVGIYLPAIYSDGEIYFRYRSDEVEPK